MRLGHKYFPSFSVPLPFPTSTRKPPNPCAKQLLVAATKLSRALQRDINSITFTTGQHQHAKAGIAKGGAAITSSKGQAVLPACSFVMELRSLDRGQSFEMPLADGRAQSGGSGMV